MDTNMVVPTGPGSCTVVYDYYLDTAEIRRLGDQVMGALQHTVHNMYIVVLQKVPSEANPKVRYHGEGPY